MFMLSAAGTIKAETAEMLSVDANTEEIAESPAQNVKQDTKESDVEAAEIEPDAELDLTEKANNIAEQEAEYNIYKKDNPVDPCDRGQDTYDYEKSWYDETQIYVNSRFCEPALWFDNFFGSDRVFEEGAAGTYIRWRNEVTIDEEDSASFNTAISASIELPGVQDRLRLTFDSEEDEDIRDIAPGNSNESRSTLGLQLDLKENARSKFSVSVKFTPKVQFRYRYTYPVTELITLRLTQELEREKKLHGARSLFDFEYLLHKQYLFRASTEAKLSEEFDGVDWLQAFVLYQRVSNKTSLSYESSVNGISEPNTVATNYRVAVRYRKNFHRKWLFYELAPEMTWPVTYDEQREAVLIERRSRWAVFFRLEVHFGNAYKKRYQDYI